MTAAVLLALALVAGIPAGASAVAADAPMRELGAGSLHWWGLHVYDARLAVAGATFDPSEPFVLTLRYARDFRGERIAETSVEEMTRLGFGSTADRARWLAAMRRLFPDVRRGDELSGTSLPGRGAAFAYNGRPIGTVDDPAFARAFFAIWLDPRTRVGELRAKLLGGAECAARAGAPAPARC